MNPFSITPKETVGVMAFVSFLFGLYLFASMVYWPIALFQINRVLKQVRDLLEDIAEGSGPPQQTYYAPPQPQPPPPPQQPQPSPYVPPSEPVQAPVEIQPGVGAPAVHETGQQRQRKKKSGTKRMKYNPLGRKRQKWQEPE